MDLIKIIMLFSSIICILEANKTVLFDVRWWEVHKYFMTISHNGLFSRKIQETLNKSFDWKVEDVEITNLLEEKREYLDKISSEKIQGVRKLRDDIVANFQDFIYSEPKNHCCHQKKGNSAPDVGCYQGRKSLIKGIAANPPPKVIKTMQDLRSFYSNIDLLYFSFYDGSMYVYPSPLGFDLQYSKCLQYNPHVRPWYKTASSPVPRDVVLLLSFDLGQGESTKENLITLEIALEVVTSLTQDDRILILDSRTVSQKETNDRHVGFGVWLVATLRNINKLTELLEETFTKHKKSERLHNEDTKRGLKKIFDIQTNLNISRRAQTVVVEVVRKEASSCRNSTIWESESPIEPTIITYLIGETQQTSGCDVMTENHHILRIKELGDIQQEDKQFKSFFQWSDYLKSPSFDLDPENDLRITLPYSSYYKRGPSLTFTLPMVINGTLVGVASVGFSKLIEFDFLIELEGFPDSYGFLIDESGRALSHPLLPSFNYFKNENGVTISKDPTYELVTRLEQNRDVQDVLQSMVDMKKGKKIVEGEIVRSTGHALDDDQGNPVTVVKRKLAYAWTTLRSFKLSLCLVIPVIDDKIYNVTYNCANPEDCTNVKFNYHLDEKFSNETTCSYFGSDVLKNMDLVKFAPSVFANPANYLLDKDPIVEAQKKGQNIFTSFSKSSINASISMANVVSGVWKQNDPLYCFIGDRYFGTVDGVFISYPGLRLNVTYDHRRRPWYQVASGVPPSRHSSVFVTVPYKDYFSGGIILSVVNRLEKRLPHGHSVLLGVAAADFSLRFVENDLKKRIPECVTEGIECFLTDNMGYTVLSLTNEKMNKLHISQAHPVIAQKLVDRELLTRQGCHDYEKDAAFLYWSFQLPEDRTNFFMDIETSSVAIYKIPFMNIFLFATLNLPLPDQSKVPPPSEMCMSTCSNVSQAPCKVNLFTSCQKPVKDMRLKFKSFPACYPSYYSPSNKYAEKKCGQVDSNTCFKSLTVSHCKLWMPICS